ncbi:hypothetical protein HY639_05830 [Candidatus Woesearchaeota archaeon]|nr:hypothetical protein [Candidatus Woesearchaeota archaeon]
MKKPGDYEIMPHDKIEALRNELSRLKSERTPEHPHSRDVMQSMDKLTETLDHFMELFQSAIEEMKIEEREEELIVTELRPLHEKIDQLIDHNQKIAQGIVAIADMLNRELPSLRVRPTLPPLESPSSSLFSTPLGPPPPVAPRPMAPPPPPKKGLF